MNTRFQTIQLLILSSLISTAMAQEVSIPDPVLNGAIRRARQKLQGPLTVQDMLSLTNLDHSYCLDDDGEFPKATSPFALSRAWLKIVCPFSQKFPVYEV
jgi:hypothetical protein